MRLLLARVQHFMTVADSLVRTQMPSVSVSEVAFMGLGNELIGLVLLQSHKLAHHCDAINRHLV